MSELFNKLDDAVDKEKQVTFIVKNKNLEQKYIKNINSVLLHFDNLIEIIAEDFVAMINLDTVKLVKDGAFSAFNEENGMELIIVIP